MAGYVLKSVIKSPDRDGHNVVIRQVHALERRHAGQGSKVGEVVVVEHKAHQCRRLMVESAHGNTHDTVVG
jgi:hypothetical protein